MASRTDQNLLVLTFYIIGVSYIINRMVESIADNIKFSFDKAAIDKQLEEYNLKDHVDVKFKFKSSYDIDALKQLMLILTNKSDNLGVYVDWDNTSLVVNFDSSSRRVIRTSPDLTRDLAVSQSPSLVAPGKTIAPTFSPEDIFSFDQEKQTYSPTKPVVNISALKSHPLKVRRKLYKNFMSRKKTIEFSVQLVLRVSELRVGVSQGENKPPMYIINCPMSIKKLPWTYALPWNKKR
ncbi:MAG: hypothetical protein AAF208_06050 [Cyanobacteria bacterium P01_A01_bin.45]